MDVLPVQSCVDMNSNSLSKVKLELVSFTKYFLLIFYIKKKMHLNEDHDRQLHLRCKKDSGFMKVST